MRVLDYGSSAVLVELDSIAQAAALHVGLQPHVGSDLVEIMPGLQTVLVRFDPKTTDARRLKELFGRVQKATPPANPAADHAQEAVVVRVDYSGADLADVARLTGLTSAEVVAAHQGGDYRVVLIGMAPGFYFLAGGDPRLKLARRSSPRTDVPKGSVGLAGELTGIYPRRGPGGWQLIGTVRDELWDTAVIPSALLAPGTRVRFVAVR